MTTSDNGNVFWKVLDIIFDTLGVILGFGLLVALFLCGVWGVIQVLP